MTHASVFSGIGGPEVAATMLGWDNLFHCEINPFGRRVLDYWYPNSKSYEDITTTDFTEWRGRVNVLTGGFPCQPFSYAGKRGGAQDDRYLWPYMFRCIDQIRPDWVVAENVAGILTMVEQGEVSEVASAPALFDTFDRVRRYQLRETFTLQRICDDLEGHGYAVQPVLVPACGVGAPHRRDRVFIIGHRTELGDTKWRAFTNPKSDGGSRATRSTSGTTERPHGQSDEQSTIGCEVRDVGLPTTDSCCEGLERAGGQRVQSDERRGCATSDNESSRTDNEDAEGSIGEIWRAIADTDINRMERNLWPDNGVQPQSGLSAEELTDRYGNLRSQQRWEYFPTVSPVHRGNDGLPFDVDRLTISFGKWRTEALKAYGNAIVPQVMYEIFRAIEQVEDSQANAW